VEDFIESQKPKPKEEEQKEKGEKKLNEKESNNNEKEKNEQKDNIIELNKDKNDINENNNEKKVVSDIKKEETIFDSMIKELSCKVLEKSHLNNKDIKVTIRNPKIFGKGFSTHVTYEVFTEPSCWTVRRRYNDFILLKQLLNKYYPRTLIPPLPEKRSGKKRFNGNFIERRMKFLQLFINDIIKDETFKANEALTVFLNYDRFADKVKGNIWL
jgi:hypothetical protein